MKCVTIMHFDIRQMVEPHDGIYANIDHSTDRDSFVLTACCLRCLSATTVAGSFGFSAGSVTSSLTRW